MTLSFETFCHPGHKQEVTKLCKKAEKFGGIPVTETLQKNS